MSVTVQDAPDGDMATLPKKLIMAAEQVELVQPDDREVEEVVADKGDHSDETRVALGEVGVRSHVSEPERGRRCGQDKKTGETPPEKRTAQKALYANRRRVRGRRGRRLPELVTMAINEGYPPIPFQEKDRKREAEASMKRRAEPPENRRLEPNCSPEAGKRRA